jgi:hypothetical protein
VRKEKESDVAEEGSEVEMSILNSLAKGGRIDAKVERLSGCWESLWNSELSNQGVTPNLHLDWLYSLCNAFQKALDTVH